MDLFVRRWTQKESFRSFLFAALPFILMNEQIALLTLLHMLCGSLLIRGIFCFAVECAHR